MMKIWGLFLSICLLSSCKKDIKKSNDESSDLSTNSDLIEKKATLFGFDVDDFTIAHDTVKYGDSFGELMTENKVDYPKIAKLSSDFRDAFDVRKIRVGKPYTILRSKDTTEKAEVFIYQNDLVNYTVVDFRDSVNVYTKKQKVSHIDKEVAGVIENGSSLSLVFDQLGVDYAVTHDFANIYAWTVDFVGLQEGDSFKVIFKEKYVNDTIYAGSEEIQAAYFKHAGKEFYAFAYENDSLKNLTDYFDEKANNLRRTFLRMPVEYGRLSSKFNLRRRIRYYGNKVRPHRGTDYAARVGTPILATADGIVSESTRKGGNGRYVKIRHNSTYSTQYLHMRKQKVKRGDRVKQGDVIGWVGMTGNTSGPHVCYRFWKNGRQVDPLREELPKAEPLAETLQPDYFEFIDPLKRQIDCIAYPVKHEEEADEVVMND